MSENEMSQQEHSRPDAKVTSERFDALWPKLFTIGNKNGGYVVQLSDEECRTIIYHALDLYTEINRLRHTFAEDAALASAERDGAGTAAGDATAGAGDGGAE